MTAVTLERCDDGLAWKALAAVGLVVLADLFFFERGVGSLLGVFVLAWCAAMLAVEREVRRRPGAWIALGAAALMGLACLDRPTLIGWLLFAVFIASAALMARIERFDDAWRWAQRLVFQGLASIAQPFVEIDSLSRRFASRGWWRPRAIIGLLAMPLAFAAAFVFLFASANPVIEWALGQVSWWDLDIGRAIFWSVVFIAVWGTFRPWLMKATLPLPDLGTGPIPGVSIGSVTLSLVTFNALFLVQNALDAAFLWSGAPLPDGVTLAEYAHRGAYPLIATALLAGLFVLVALRPGSETASRPAIRRLLILWVAQNLFLVASSILRTLDYIDAFSLTRLRIAALIWMALVGLGLLLICWRMLRGKSAAWLVNANTLAAGVVLAACSFVDLGAVAAWWNVGHAREVDGGGAELDLCYLSRLESTALVPLVQLEQKGGLEPALADRVAWLRAQKLAALRSEQSHWRGWTWRGARRLAKAEALAAGLPQPRAAPFGRECDGTLQPPPPAPSAPTAPLTSAQAR